MNDSKSKSFAIKSILGNDKLAKTIFDAVDAPIGSTKKKIAKSILASIHRSGQNYGMDGQGGLEELTVMGDSGRLGSYTPPRPSTPTAPVTYQNPAGPYLQTVAPSSLPGLEPPSSTLSVSDNRPLNGPVKIAQGIDYLLGLHFNPATGRFDQGQTSSLPASSPSLSISGNKAGKASGSHVFSGTETPVESLFLKNNPGFSEGFAKEFSTISNNQNLFPVLMPKLYSALRPSPQKAPVVTPISSEKTDQTTTNSKAENDIQALLAIGPGMSREGAIAKLKSLNPSWVPPSEVTPIKPQQIVTTGDFGTKFASIIESSDSVAAEKALMELIATPGVTQQTLKDWFSQLPDDLKTKYDDYYYELFPVFAPVAGSSDTSFVSGPGTGTGSGVATGTGLGTGSGTGTLPQTGTDLETMAKQYYAAGTGPDYFANQVMSNKDILKQFLPQEVIDSMPSGLPQEATAALYNTLKKSFNIDAQHDRLLEMQNQGLNYTNDLKTYVKDKDEVLFGLDKLIDEAQQKAAYSDMSDPRDRKDAQNYMNYLTTMRGYHAQRYGDMIQQSVDDFNKKSQIALNTYNSDYAKFQEAFTLQGNLLTGKLDQIKSLATNMYNALANADAAAVAAQNAQLTKLQNELSMANSYADYLSKQRKLETGEGYDKLNLKNTADSMGVTLDNDGVITGMKTFDPIVMRDSAVLGQKLSPDIATQNAGWFLSDYMKKEASGGNYINSYNKILDSQAQYKNDPVKNAHFNLAANAAREGLASGLKEFLSEGEKLSSLREAIRELVGQGFWGKPAVASDKASFVQKHQDDLSSDVAKGLFDFYLMGTKVNDAGGTGYEPAEWRTFFGQYGDQSKVDDSTLAFEMGRQLADIIDIRKF